MNYTINILKQYWHLIDVQAVPYKSYNDVYFATQTTHDHREVVLKLCLEDVYENEKRALLAFKGQGGVALLDSHDEHRALLLKRIHPGTSLKALFPVNDERAVDITCTLLQNLHTAPIPVRHYYPHLSYWLRALDKPYDDPMGKLAQHVEKARILRDQLLTTAPPDVLLHGDLHHDNILLDEGKGGYTVIDPKGVVGDPAYDTAVFMCNPIPDLLNDPNPMDILKKRIHHFSKSLTMDPIRIHSCAYIHAVMSACWSMEDYEDPSYSIKVADILREILSTP